MTRRTLDLVFPSFRLRMVEESDSEETPSLPPFPVVETDGVEIPESRPGLAKCCAQRQGKRAAGGGK